MSNKKLLWISNFAPYISKTHAGGKTFSYYFDKIYNSDKFDISIICCLWEKNIDTLTKNKEILNEKLKKLEKIRIIHPEQGLKYKVKRLVNIESRFNIFTKNSNMISNYSVNEIISTLKKWKKQKYNPEVIILEWTSIVLLARRIKKIFPNAKLIASEHDVSFVGFKRKYEFEHGFKKLIWKLKYSILKKNEIKNLKLCDYTMVHNKDNSSFLTEQNIDKVKIKWLVPYFYNMSNIIRKPDKKYIIFFGLMSNSENYLSAIWFIKNVMPLISDLNLKFIIMGANPNRELLKYESEKVVITGFVDSIEEYFSNAMCFVAPLLLGAGIKVKILEALSSGIPVLTNEIGIDGIDAVNDKHYFFCKTENDYTNIIRDLYKDKLKLDENEIKNFIKNNFNLQSSLNQYEELLIGENKSDV